MTEDEVIEHIDEETNRSINEPTPHLIHEKSQKPNKKRSKATLFIILGSILIILVAAGVGAWWWFTQRATPEIQPSKPAQIQMSETITDPLLARFITPTTGETWNSQPISIKKQGYMSDDSTSTYFEVGRRGDRTIIMTLTQELGMYTQLFEKSTDGTITYIARPNANGDYSSDTVTQTNYQTADYWSKTVNINKTIHYDSLSLPPSLVLDHAESVFAPDYTTLGTYLDPAAPETTIKESTVKKLGSSTLIKVERAYVDTGLTAINYAINTPIGTRINLTYKPIPSKVDNFSWKNKLSSTGTIGGIVRGCGAVGSSVSRSDILTDTDFSPIGTTDDGQMIYGFKDSTATLPKVVYDEYKDFNSYDPSKIVSFDSFINNHAIFAYKSANNGWLIYTIDSYAAVGGCGKPVVYLYPTQAETVNVKVGAHVKLSEPLYDPTLGWQHVIAQPNGQLTYNGNSYSSLFWEGTGFGQYPAITTGTVVRHSEAIATIRTHLTEQGLNQRETNDFMAYWQDQVPNKPFVRLAWFNTSALNELAPLYITPTPQTVIRVFLDMKGLDQPISIPTQTFAKQARNGFTVVEWGGLLHTKL